MACDEAQFTMPDWDIVYFYNCIAPPEKAAAVILAIAWQAGECTVDSVTISLIFFGFSPLWHDKRYHAFLSNWGCIEVPDHTTVPPSVRVKCKSYWQKALADWFGAGEQPPTQDPCRQKEGYGRP